MSKKENKVRTLLEGKKPCVECGRPVDKKVSYLSLCMDCFFRLDVTDILTNRASEMEEFATGDGNADR